MMYSIRPRRLPELGFPKGTLVESVQRLTDSRIQGAPFFLYIHSNIVHNYIGEEPIASAMKGQTEMPGAEEFRAVYQKRVRKFDQEFADILSILKASGLYDEALIIFYSDHGEILMDYDSTFGHGRTMNEVLLHVPLVIKPPKNWNVKPRETAERVQLIDVAPTIYQAASESTAGQTNSLFQGTSLLGILKGENQNLAGRPVYAGIQFYDNEMASVRDGKWKYVYDLREEKSVLVDLENRDLDEKADHSSEAPEINTDLSIRFLEAYDLLINEILGSDDRSAVEIDEERLKALKALGYVK